MPIAGKYQLTNSENFDEYMKAVGVAIVVRRIVGTAKHVTEEISNADDEWSIKTSYAHGLKTTEIKFKLGEPFEEDEVDGRTCKSQIVLEGETLVHTQWSEGGDFTILREFKDNEMTMTLTAKNVTSTRIYTKV